jgi:hypothetical protein
MLNNGIRSNLYLAAVELVPIDQGTREIDFFEQVPLVIGYHIR